MQSYADLSLLAHVQNGTWTDDYEDWDEALDKLILCEDFTEDIRKISKYYMPAIIAVGLIGNLLSAVTFMATKLRNIPSSYYLTALALADSGMLLCHLLVLTSGIYTLRQGFCQLTQYLGGVFSFLSVWYVVSFTMERYIAVKHPLKRLHWCTVGRARIIVISLAAFGCVFNSHIFITAHSVTTLDNQTACSVHEHFMIMAETMNHIDTAFTFVVPSILIVVWNMGIASKTICTRLRKRNASSWSGSKKSTRLSASSRASSVSTEMTAGLLLPALIGETFANGGLRLHVRRRFTDDRKMTCMLFVVSLVFLIMNFPDHLVRMAIFGLWRTGTWENLSTSRQCWITAGQKITKLIFNTNFSVNFFLYCLVGGNFRVHLRSMFNRKSSRRRSR